MIRYTILSLILLSLLALSACSTRPGLQTPTAGPQASPTQPAKATQPPDAETQPVPTREEKTATAAVSTPVRPTAAPSPTAVPTGAGGQGGAAQATVEAFLQAVESGDIEQALSYWNLNRPDQPIGYARSIRQLVNQWAADQRRFHIQETSYHGFVGPRDWRRLDESDPRVEGALVQVAVDGLRGAFDLDKTSGAWRICGWMQPGDQVAAPG